MKFIAHRRNTLVELNATPVEFGVEVDIRSQGNQLIMHHDPFQAGESFDVWIAAYRHDALILNVKEEGLEDRLIRCMRDHGIDDYFFLDQSFPFLVKTAAKGERRCAVRVSEFETLDTALSLAGKVDWVWVDCFSRFPLDLAGWQRLRDAGFRICLVSPELLGRRAESEIMDLQRMFAEWDVEPDAVCAKMAMIPVWKRA